MKSHEDIRKLEKRVEGCVSEVIALERWIEYPAGYCIKSDIGIEPAWDLLSDAINSAIHRPDDLKLTSLTDEIAQLDTDLISQKGVLDSAKRQLKMLYDELGNCFDRLFKI